jgi:predicted nucleotidyltransferase
MNRDAPILQRCVATIKVAYSERLEGIVLYGSCARGEESSESDIDLLVVLNGDFNFWTGIDRLIDILYPIELEYDQLISARPASTEAYRKGTIQFYRNVLEEGIVV